MRSEVLCISVLKVASGPRVKLVSCKSALNPRWFILGGGPGVGLALCCFLVYSTRLFVLLFCSCVFRSF